MFEISKFSLQKIWFANKTSKNLVNVFRKNMLVFFSFLSLKLFLCSFWLYMYLKFPIWSTNLIKCTNSICTYLILALCQIGSLFLFLHYFHSFRDDMGVKQCKNIFYKIICWVFALGVSQNWIEFESPPKMKKKKTSQIPAFLRFFEFYSIRV